MAMASTRSNSCGASPSSNNRLRVLTVGDGDLTLSLALARAYGPKQLDLVASTLLESSEELVRTYPNSRQVLDELEERQVPVRYGVDATKLSDDTWDAILFHHPHLGPIVDERAHAERHFVLLAHYFYSAKSCLRPGGIVHVCLCGSQPQTWRVIEAAQRQGLVLAKQHSTTAPLDCWLSPSLVARPVESHYPAPRRYRNGKLGSKHFLGRYGYQHRRTHGGSSDVNVSGSIHFVFSYDNRNAANHAGGHKELECSICGTELKTLQALQQHQEAPALPDPMDDAPAPVDKNITSTEERDSAAVSCSLVNGDADTLTSADVLSKKQMEEQRSTQTVGDGYEQPLRDDHFTGDTTSVLFTSTVSDAYEGKRLKWYLRQDTVNALGLSKHECAKLFKESRVLLNGTVVPESSRILHSGDKVVILERSAGKDDLNGSTSSSTKIPIHYQSENVLVAFKPVGMRTVGSFSTHTLEMTLSEQRGTSFKSVSKLDTGCAGLCILEREGANVKQVSRTFIALLHGHVPDAWNGRSIKLTTERRWGKGGNTNKRSCVESKDCPQDDSSNDFLVDEIKSGDSVVLHLVETTGDSPDTPALSTVKVTTSSSAGGLCSAICFLLRKTGHAVINDRFCRREYQSLPRSIRNLIRNRLCIGCYQVSMLDGEEKTISVDTPERLSALYWERHCQKRTL